MRHNGQTLIEVLVAVSAIIIILSAITTIVISSLNQASRANMSVQATQYAQEGLEQLKISEELPPIGTFCLNADLTTDQLCSRTVTSTNLGEYRRTVRVANTAGCPNANEVTVEVFWKDAACTAGDLCHKTTLTTCL